MCVFVLLYCYDENKIERGVELDNVKEGLHLPNASLSSSYAFIPFFPRNNVTIQKC